MKKTKPKKRIIKRAKKPAKKKKVVKKKPARKKAVKKPVKKTRKKARPKKRKIVRRKPLRKARKVKRKPVKKKPATAKTRKKQKRKKVSASLRRAKRSSATQRLQRKPKKRVVKRKKVVKRKRRKPVKKAKKQVVRKRRVVKKRVVRRKLAKKKVKPKKTRRKPKAFRRARQHAKLAARKPAKRRRKKTRMARRAYSGGGPLEQLFESPAKVQTMKLFFRNPEVNFLSKEAAKIMKMNLDLAKKQIKRLEKIGLLKTRQVSPRKQLFSINPNFDFFNELRELILKSSPVSKDKMLKAIRGLGKMKLVLLSGLFTGNDMARADLLIVGDSINQRKLIGFIKNLEAEAGTDINCVIMTTEEFKYRYDMYDRFVRDLLSEKGELLINRLGM